MFVDICSIYGTPVCLEKGQHLKGGGQEDQNTTFEKEEVPKTW